MKLDWTWWWLFKYAIPQRAWGTKLNSVDYNTLHNKTWRQIVCKDIMSMYQCLKCLLHITTTGSLKWNNQEYCGKELTGIEEKKCQGNWVNNNGNSLLNCCTIIMVVYLISCRAKQCTRMQSSKSRNTYSINNICLSLEMGSIQPWLRGFSRLSTSKQTIRWEGRGNARHCLPYTIKTIASWAVLHR